MVENLLVTKLREISDKIIADHNSVSLIMLLGDSTPEHTTAFDFVISAKWLNDYNQDVGIDVILDYLYGNLTEKELEHISRVTIIHTDDMIIQNITRNIGMQGGVSWNLNCQFGNVIIPLAIIFESRYEG